MLLQNFISSRDEHEKGTETRHDEMKESRKTARHLQKIQCRQMVVFLRSFISSCLVSVLFQVQPYLK